MPKLANLKVKLFTDGADKAQILDMAQAAVDRGLHHQSIAAQESRRRATTRPMRATWSRPFPTGTFPSRFSPTTSPRWWRRRSVIAVVGQQRLRQAAGHHDARRAAVRGGARAVARRRQSQHDGDLHARSGREGGRRARRRCAGLRLGVRRTARRPRHRLSPDHAGCGRAGAHAPSNVEIIWASTREVFNVVEADAMGCHIITAPADVLQEAAGAGDQDRGGTLAGSREGVPR